MADTPGINFYPRVHAEIIAGLRPTLWLAAAGPLIVLVDLQINAGSLSGSGAGRGLVWKLDPLHDSIGYVLILSALAYLRRAPAPDHAKRYISSLAIFGLVGIAASILEVFGGSRTGVLGVFFLLFSVCQTLAVVAFLWTLAQFCNAALESTLERAWRHAMIAVAVTWVPLTVLGGLLALSLIVTGRGPVLLHPGSYWSVCAALTVLGLPLLWIGTAFFKTIGWVAPLRLSSCHVCGYPVTNLPGPQCPECGTQFATERGSSEPGLLANSDTQPDPA